MLKGIPKILSPELLKVLCEMGHGDRVVIADGNFPASEISKDSVIIRMDGHGVCEVMEAMLQLYPLDTYVKKPVTLMEVMAGDTVETPIWDEYAKIIAATDARGEDAIRHIDRFDFYKEAKKAYAVICTSESTLYANIMLQKGVV